MLMSEGKHSRQRNASSRPTGGCEYGVSVKKKANTAEMEPIKVAGW